MSTDPNRSSAQYWHNWYDLLQERKPEFPYVQECAECHSRGWLLRDTKSWELLEQCSKCDSRGYITPPEWVENE